MEFRFLLPGRPADLVARVVDGQLVIVPPAKPVPAPPNPAVRLAW